MLFEQKNILKGITQAGIYAYMTHYICKRRSICSEKSEETQADIPPHPQEKKGTPYAGYFT
jgi:hypothetical protein